MTEHVWCLIALDGTKSVPFAEWVWPGKAAGTYLSKTGHPVYGYDTKGLW
jgi:hypothetical protein